jgi:hypothetical protein
MTSGHATFGDLLSLASSELAGARAPTQTVTPGRDAAEISDGILHVVNVLTRYTTDQTRMIGQLPDRQLAAVSAWDRAAVQAHDLLMSAQAVLRPRMRGPGPEGSARSLPGRRIHSAATALAAARDLLQSHFAPHRSGARVGNSGWALVVVSPPVGRAQLSEIASIARQSAAAAESALRPGYPLPETGDRLVTACQLLNQAAISVDEASRSEPVTKANRELLRAVPVNAPPPRGLVADPESVPELCQAVITTAERARHAAWTATGQDPQSPAISVASWQRIASAAMVTSHHCQVLCGTLADRTSREPTALALHADLAQAAEHAGSARGAWLDATREYQEITTDIRDHMSPAAAEAAELAFWTGRLAYGDPAWNLSSGPSHAARPGEALAPELADLPDVVAAIHHACEAVGQLATANLEQAKSAIRGDRVLVPTRVLPENYDIPSPYTPAPASYQTSLVMCCADTSASARQLADAVGEIAIETRAPSRTLATAREVAQRPAEFQSASMPVVGGSGLGKTRPDTPGPLESELRDLGVTNPRTLWRAAALDRASRQLVAEAAPRGARRQAGGAHAQAGPGSAAGRRSRVLDATRADAGACLRKQPGAGGIQAEA